MYQDMMDTIGFVGKYDPEVSAAMEKELARQRRNLELIASENIVSPAVMAAMGSVLTNKYAEGLPELCFSTLPSTGALICIKRGESGYYPSDWNTPDCAQNRQIADEQNQRLGVTPSQEEAMVCGSMHGWTVPGADPAFVEEMQKKQEQTGGMTLAQSM